MSANGSSSVEAKDVRALGGGGGALRVLTGAIIGLLLALEILGVKSEAFPFEAPGPELVVKESGEEVRE